MGRWQQWALDTYSADTTSCTSDQDRFTCRAELGVLGVDGIVDVATKGLGQLERSCKGVGVHCDVVWLLRDEILSM
jgi:hypothetical protein